MNKLLRANFSRLWKNKCFWIMILIMSGLGVYSAHVNIVYHMTVSELYDADFLNYVTYTACCLSIFCSMFSGTEHSDGTIRNKLIAGHLSPSIYLSNWLTNVAAALMMFFAFLCSYCALGFFFLDVSYIPYKATLETTLLCFPIGIFTVIANASFFTMFAMLMKKKSTSVTVCLILFFGFMIISFSMKQKLDQPEFVIDETIVTDGVEQKIQIPNQLYMQSPKREIYETLLDALPVGQSIQLTELNVLNPFLMIAFSSAICVMTTGLGIFFFKKRICKEGMGMKGYIRFVFYIFL